MSATASARPDFGRIYGVTFDKDTKAPIVRAPRVLKVGIGIPKGRAIQVFMHAGQWHIRHGKWEKTTGKDKLVMKTVYRGGTVVNGTAFSNKKSDVEAWHNAHKDEAAVSNRPQKIPYFTFSRRTIIEGPDGKPIETFEPDFDAIEAHGDSPRRLPIILTSEQPLYQEMALWSASEQRCHGDGIVAERLVTFGSAKDANWKEAKDGGQKVFSYSPCATGGCPLAGVECKPHSTLNLQLAYAMRLGATAYFTTTSIVSAAQLFSSITEIREAVESRGYSIAGIPMDMVLGSFRANHDGKPSIQPCVSVELRAAGKKILDQILADNSWVPAQLGTATKMISAAAEETIYDAAPETLAPAIAAEFTDAEFDEEDDSATTAPSPAAAATQAKQEEVGDKLRKARAAKEMPAPAAAPASAATAPAPASTLWPDRSEMNKAFIAQRTRIGEKPFADIIAKHGVMMGSMAADDPKAAEVFRDMAAVADAEF